MTKVTWGSEFDYPIEGQARLVMQPLSQLVVKGALYNGF